MPQWPKLVMTLLSDKPGSIEVRRATWKALHNLGSAASTYASDLETMAALEDEALQKEAVDAILKIKGMDDAAMRRDIGGLLQDLASDDLSKQLEAVRVLAPVMATFLAGSLIEGYDPRLRHRILSVVMDFLGQNE